MVELEKIHRLYGDLVSDISFDRLELSLGQTNIFSILNVQNSELRHSNFIAWLLDPKGSHNLGSIFLKRFLRQVFASKRFSEINSLDVETLNLDSVEVFREWKHIDILVKSDEFLVCIENKVFSKEHSNQLVRYHKIIEAEFPKVLKTYVYLTPEGTPSELASDVYEPLSYGFIIQVIEQILDVYGRDLSAQVMTYLKDYCSTVRREIMKNDDATALAQKIYKNHKALFDFVLENRPDQTSKINDLLTSAIMERGWELGSISKSYVRFIPTEIRPLIYYNQTVTNGWKNGETFLFEIKLYTNTNKLGFRSVIAPADATYDIAALSKVLSNIEGYKPSRGNTWLTHFRQNTVFDFDAAEDWDEVAIRKKLNQFLDKISPTVSRIQSEFQLNREILLAAKDEALR